MLQFSLIVSANRLFLGDRTERFDWARKSDPEPPTSQWLQITYFSLPNHLYENLWLQNLSPALVQKVAPALTPRNVTIESPAFLDVMMEIGHFLEVVDPRLAGATCRLVMTSKSLPDTVPADDVICVSCPDWYTLNEAHPKDASQGGCAAWINVDNEDQQAFALARHYPADDSAEDMGSPDPSVRRLLIRPKEGIVWNPGGVKIREVFSDAAAMSVKVLTVVPILSRAADQRPPNSA